MFHNLKSQRTLDNSTSNLTFNKLEIINKNLLYMTHEMDKCVAMLQKLTIDKKLQAQVDEYFEEDHENIPEDQKGN